MAAPEEIFPELDAGQVTEIPVDAPNEQEAHEVDEAHETLEAQEALQAHEAHDGELEPVGAEKRWPGWPGHSVFRILVPSQKVGGIIGRKGENIKKMCEESKSRIKILDGPPGAPERAVLSADT